MINLKTMAAVALGLAATTAASQAAIDIINGTLGISPLGPVTYSGGISLSAATSVTVSTLELVNTTPTIYKGLNNDFAVGDYKVNTYPTALTLVTISNPTLTTSLSGISSFLAFNSDSTKGDTYNFKLTSWTTSSAGADNLNFEGVGVLSDTQHHFKDTPTKISASFTTTGPGTAVNGSFTLSTVPEPSTYIAGLGALCLFGFTALPKRKN
jgi:hypothetical protein